MNQQYYWMTGRLIDDHQEHCDICGVLEYDRTIPDKRQKPEDVSGGPSGQSRTAPGLEETLTGPFPAWLQPHRLGECPTPVYPIPRAMPQTPFVDSGASRCSVQAVEQCHGAPRHSAERGLRLEKASQEKARQVERARLEWDRQETARQSRERRGPERDFGPSR